MAPKESYVRLTSKQQKELAQLAGTEGWRLLSRDALPSVFPSSFRDKLTGAVLMVSRTVSGTTTVVCNAARVDASAQAIDQEPFAVVVYPVGVSSGGMFLHHGDWPGRTASAPPAFWQQVQASGVSTYFLSRPPYGATSGPLATLPTGERAGFEAVVLRLKELEPRGKHGT
jgi:hypothetical protein